MYRHNIIRINFTGYDVRRGEDVVHPATQHCNIMTLNPHAMESESVHPFWYAKVLGIYHVNVIYIGEGNIDYRPFRLEFLWVRWYELRSPGDWKTGRLDELQFPPMADEDAFGFLDPASVLRACHLIPSLRKGKVYPDGSSGLSHYAKDTHNWKSYLVNWYVYSGSLSPLILKSNIFLAS